MGAGGVVEGAIVPSDGEIEAVVVDLEALDLPHRYAGDMPTPAGDRALIIEVMGPVEGEADGLEGGVGVVGAGGAAEGDQAAFVAQRGLVDEPIEVMGPVRERVEEHDGLVHGRWYPCAGDARIKQTQDLRRPRKGHDRRIC